LSGKTYARYSKSVARENPPKHQQTITPAGVAHAHSTAIGHERSFDTGQGILDNRLVRP
jgi:hypothetical protein